jgi:NADH:ubiquinone oxidoreductase subunit 6 (subunit J)
MSETVNAIAFAVLAFACIGGAVAMLSTRNVVHAAFWLLEVSVAAAGVFYLLDASYIALVQLLVYAGAVAVLMIFSIMITLRRREDAIRPQDFSPIGAVLAVAFCAAMVIALRGQSFAAAKMPEVVPSLATFGRALFSVRGWALPFEIASLVLTAALVGAVWWSRDGDE